MSEYPQTDTDIKYVVVIETDVHMSHIKDAILAYCLGYVERYSFDLENYQMLYELEESNKLIPIEYGVMVNDKDEIHNLYCIFDEQLNHNELSMIRSRVNKFINIEHPVNYIDFVPNTIFDVYQLEETKITKITKIQEDLS